MEQHLEPDQIPEVKTLTVDEQKLMYRIGQQVYVRYDGDDYTYDWIGEMDSIMGDLVTIINIYTIRDNPFSTGLMDYDTNNMDDLIIFTRTDNDSTFYFLYKSLYNPIGITPDYSPKKIIREDLNIPNYLPPPENLSLDEQLRLFNINSEVYIRPDADRYTLDWLDGYMDNQKGKIGTILRVKQAKNIYDHNEMSMYDIDNEDDLVLEVSVNISYGTSWNWYYKSLYVPKMNKPTYLPRNITKESVKYKYGWIAILCDDANESDDLQSFLFSVGKSWAGGVTKPKLFNENYYPICLFVYIGNRNIETTIMYNRPGFYGTSYESAIEWLESHIKLLNEDSDYEDLNMTNNIDSHIYHYKDMEWKNLVEFGELRPTYSPRKVIRESIEHVLSPKSDEEIGKIVKNLSLENRIKKIWENNLPHKWLPSNEEVAEYINKVIKKGDIKGIVYEYYIDSPKSFPYIMKFCKEFRNEKEFNDRYASFIYEYESNWFKTDYKKLDEIHDMSSDELVNKYGDWSVELPFLENIFHENVENNKSFEDFAYQTWAEFWASLKETSWTNEKV